MQKMSSSVLFGNNSSRGAGKNLVEFKAGKMTLKGKMVYPDTRKGQLYVYQSDDTLMHFCWKDRTTGIVEDDLIIFPDDCEFKHVTQCKTGRVYLLKFKSSSRKFFFWLQDLKTDKDDEYCKKINEVLNNPPTPSSQRNNGNPEGDLQNFLNNMSQQQLMQLFGGVSQMGGLGSILGSMNRPFSSNRTSSSYNGTTTALTRTSTTGLPLTTSSIRSDSSKSTGSDKLTQNSKVVKPVENSHIRLSDLQNCLSALPATSNPDSVIQRHIATELSIAIPTALSSTENLESGMSMYLPSGDNLSITLSSPQFAQALVAFWSAFQSGQIAPIIQQFGLSAEVVNAATNGNIAEFLNSLEIEARNNSSNTDYAIDSPSSQNISSNSKETSDNPNLKGTRNDKKDDDEGMNLD